MSIPEDKDEDSRKVLDTNNQYPLDSSSYKILEKIEGGVSATVYRAICIPMNNSTVAIKSIDLGRSRADFEAKTLSLLCHPNILNAYCSFAVEQCLWVVMPYMSGGSLQSIMAFSFPNGLPEPCIAAVLKEILTALSYLHGQGHLHRDIKAGNILIDSDGSVKLSDFGVSASIYESFVGPTSSSSLMITDVAGTPYWVAPEVIRSHTGYSFQADIWSFGITALELAHGRPPLSDLPPSKSLIMKILKRFRVFGHFGRAKGSEDKKFSKSFKEMVGLCLDQDPSKRPSAEELLKHSFFRNCKGQEYLVKNVLHGLPPVEQRFKGAEIQRCEDDDEDKDKSSSSSSGNVKLRRVMVRERSVEEQTETISGWNFNEEGFQLDPVFPETEKKVKFAGEILIDQEKVQAGSSGDVGPVEESGGGVAAAGGGGMILETLLVLKKSLDEQKERVSQLIVSIGGEETVENNGREEQLMQLVERLRTDLEIEKNKRVALEIELDTLKQQDSVDE